MLYLTKGEARKDKKDGFKVTHMGRTVLLDKKAAEVWKNGRYKFGRARMAEDIRAVCYMANVGLAELEREETEIAKYRILSRCFITVIKKPVGIYFSARERRVLCWLRYPGFRIGIAELVALEENKVMPNREMRSGKNWRLVAEQIYGARPLVYKSLEKRMEHSKSRNETVAALMRLVKRKQVRLY